MQRRLRQHAVRLALAAIAACSLCGPSMADQPRVLAVCADPDNLPYSNDRLEGFENRIAGLIAEELHTSIRYTWSVQRRGFLRRTLQAGACDVVMGVPAGLPGVSVTHPYYASTYVFVSMRSRNLQLGDFDAPVLRALKVGLQAVGAEGANTPPASALARRGLANNVVGFATWGEDNGENPQARIIDAVAAGEIDTAVVWGPFAGYFAKRHQDRLILSPVAPDPQTPALPFVYEIALGVRNGEDAFKTQLQEILDRRQHDIQAILNEYGVPLVPTTTGRAAGTALGQADVPRD
jgi:mxaJ protein